jgi:hypothetical protein
VHPSEAAQELPKKEELPSDRVAQGADGGVKEEKEDDEDKDEVKEEDDKEDEKKDKEDVKEEDEKDDEDKEDVKEEEDAKLEFNGKKIADNAAEDGVAKEEAEKDDEKELDEEDDDDDEDDKIDVKEDVAALLVGEKLSGAFKKKAETIFEAALKSKLAPAKKKLQEKYENRLRKSEDKIAGKLVNQLDSYLDYVVEEWMNENKLAVEKGLQVEIVEGFMSGLQQLFKEHYIDVPESKTNVLEELSNKVEKLESELNEQINKNIALNKKLTEAAKSECIADLCEGLSKSEVEKLKTLAEGISFENKDQFVSKMGVIKGSYFPNVRKMKGIDEPILEEGGEEVSGSMSVYVNAISRTVQK